METITKTISNSNVQIGIQTFIVAFFIALAVVPMIIKVAKSNNLLDKPNERKEHKEPIPTLGGIGIFVGFLVSFVIAISNIDYNQLSLFLVSIVILFITGIVDDLKDLKATKKLLVQVFVSFLVALSGIRIESLQGILGVTELPTTIQYCLTIFILTGITNAVNLIDGINGLAAGIIFINSIVFGCLFHSFGNITYSILAFSLAGALLGFLRYNFNKAKIFMGDTGSLIIGFSIAVLGVKYIQINNVQDPNSIVLVFAILVLPVFDTLRVFTIRVVNGKSPFSADTNHIHHLLVKTGYDHKKASIIMYIANVVLILFGFFFSQFNFSTLSSLISLFILAMFLSEILAIKRALRIRTRVRLLFNQIKERQKENHLLVKINK